MSRIYFASDHAGFNLKTLLSQHIAKRQHIIFDMGAYTNESCDYPLFAHKLCEAFEYPADFGVLVCGTGIGMAMAANRHSGIRAALCATELHARLARAHNNANVLCLGARITGDELAIAITETFLATDFEGGRHQKRLDMINI
ncbi:MAG: ribose 5-phosphate isomerase B [Desulfovibrio sp.]|jgi:ribose 5-phosphate isomerase B|nr:ribose 5-phosphate isomerase B [Desulfovibrio sp.]